MRDNKKRYDKRIKIIMEENKEKEQKQDNHFVLNVHDSGLSSKSNYNIDDNGGK
jgi:hypothetical protein